MHKSIQTLNMKVLFLRLTGTAKHTDILRMAAAYAIIFLPTSE